MDIQFKKESLFDKFSLSTTLSKGELLRLFQTRPDLRKELPVFIQTINNEQKLYVEELFTSFLDGKNFTIEEYLQEQKGRKILEDTLSTEIVEPAAVNQYRKRLAVLVNVVRRFDEVVSVLKISGKTFDELVDATEHFQEIRKELQYARVDNDGNIFRSFCECLWKGIENAISSSIKSQNSKTVNSTYRILGAVTNSELKKKFIGSFAAHTSDFFDSFSTRLEDEQVYKSSIDFACGLNVSLFKNKDIYTSFKFFCGKLTDNAENNEAYLFEHFPKLIERLKPSDIGALFEGFASCCFQLVKLENIENNTYDKISKTAETARQLLPLIDEDDIEEGKLDIVKILIGLADNGEEWYSTYQTHIKNIVNKTKLSESLYEVCYMIYHASSLKEYRIAFSNLLSDVSGFNTELVVMIQKKERLESVCESTKDKGKYILYSTIKSQIGDEIPTPKDIDNFILNYYALSIINSELKQFFKNIQQMVFTPLMMLDNVPTYSFGYGGLTPKGEFMKDLFMELPNDWEIDLGGTKIVVRDFLRSKLNCYSGSNYGNSKSKTYMIKCDNAISARKTPSATTSKSATTTTTISSTTRSSYTPSTSSSGTNGKVVCGVLSAIAFLIMIICFACEAPVGGVIFLIGAVAFLIGAAKYDDIKDNGKALTAIILIPIILCCIFGPIVGNANSSSSSSSSSDSSGGGGYNNNSEYTVTLNKDGGYGGTSTVYVEYGDSMPYATAPSKSGYEFGGYYTSRNGVGTQYYTVSMSSARKWNKSSNTTLYAYWIEEDDSIALTENNFESYFNFTSSCSVSRYDYGSSGTATYSFSISPKSSFNHYNYDNPSSITVTIGLDISSISTSYGKPSEYKITVTLYKSSGYSYSGSRSYSVGAYENYWIDEIYDVDAKIYN